MMIESSSRFDKLDEAITIDILSRLSVYSLFQCRVVCHKWRRIIVYNHYFTQIHSNRSIQTHNKIINTTAPEPFDDSGLSYIIQVNSYRGNNLLLVEGGLMSKHATIINCHFDRFLPPHVDPISSYHFQFGPSCNGLLCLCSGHIYNHKPVAICNPVTGEYVSLPEGTIETPNYNVLTGFGFDAIKEEYKVVRISRGHYRLNVEIHTLGTEKWRQIESPLDVVDNKPYSSQVFVNGCLHWRTLYVSEEAFVVALDISTEKFHTFLPPPKLCLYMYEKIELCNWKGQLGVIAEFFGGPIHVWQLKNDNGGLWTKILTLPIAFLQRHLDIYEIRHKYCTTFDRIGAVICHVGSIVSLKNIIKEEEKVRMIPKLGLINETTSSKRKYRSPLEVKIEKSCCEIQLPLKWIVYAKEIGYKELEDMKSECEERESLWEHLCFNNAEAQPI